jgi:hypothetical protein
MTSSTAAFERRLGQIHYLARAIRRVSAAYGHEANW